MKDIFIRDRDLSRVVNDIHRAVELVGAPRQKEIYRLAIKEGSSFEDVASELGLKPNSVQRSLAHLKGKVVRHKSRFFKRTDYLRYRAAERVIRLLGKECERNGHNDVGQLSYEELVKHVIDIERNLLTNTQRKVFEMWFARGLTQEHAGEMLGRDQSTIHKTIYGNIDYAYNKHHGGIISKIGKELRKRGVPYCCQLVEDKGRPLSFLLAGDKGK